jgi:sterol 3beta-glucosyltransferase
VHTDQPFWARRLVALGAGTHPIPMKRVDGPGLATAISTALPRRPLRDGARAVQDALRGEDGTLPLRKWLHQLG